jgi:hypothetical protein
MDNPVRKQGDTIMGFGNPSNWTVPLGQITLHRFVKSTANLELWLVEYADQPEVLYELWINKKDGTGK